MRMLSPRNIHDKKHTCFPFDGIMQEVFGEPETFGAWLIWGNEKQGKTRTALLLARYLACFGDVLYVSAEEGVSKSFAEACLWAGIHSAVKGIFFTEYVELDELKEKLRKRRAPRIVFIDNFSIYKDEVTTAEFKKLLQQFPHTLFIFLAHEERREPYTAAAKFCRKLAKIIIYVEGLACNVGGRCPGGYLMIDEDKATLYHGTKQEAL